MQRAGLVPLHYFMRGRAEQETVFLDLACGTGRFLTFIKDNYPGMKTIGVRDMVHHRAGGTPQAQWHTTGPVAHHRAGGTPQGQRHTTGSVAHHRASGTPQGQVQYRGVLPNWVLLRPVGLGSHCSSYGQLGVGHCYSRLLYSDSNYSLVVAFMCVALSEVSPSCPCVRPLPFLFFFWQVDLSPFFLEKAQENMKHFSGAPQGHQLRQSGHSAIRTVLSA